MAVPEFQTSPGMRDILAPESARWRAFVDVFAGVVESAGYRQIIDRAHAHGLKIYGATLLPYEGARYYSQSGEAVRQAVNAWIRSP